MLNPLKPDLRKLKKEFDEIVSRNPLLCKEGIAKKMIDDRAWKCALIGFFTSFIGWVTIIIPLLIDLILSTRMETEMIYLLACSYGYKLDDPRLEPLKNYILSETPPEGQALRVVVQMETTTLKEFWHKKRHEAKQELGQEVIKQTFQKVVKSGRKTASKTAKKMFIKVLTRSITKIIPIVGGIIGYFLNNRSAKKTGRLAQKWLERLDKELEYTDNII